MQLQERNPKLETQLPVAQFGIQLHMTLYNGTLRQRNKTEFINFLVQNLVTRDNERISGKNLRNSYYNIDSKPVAPIKD
jgi:hypothetical protein